MAARLRVYPPTYPGDGTMVLFTADAVSQRYVFDLVGQPPDASAALLAALKAIEAAITAQTAVISTDDAALLKAAQGSDTGPGRLLAEDSPPTVP